MQKMMDVSKADGSLTEGANLPVSQIRVARQNSKFKMCTP
jgi:hypothetical protein